MSEFGTSSSPRNRRPSPVAGWLELERALRVVFDGVRNELRQVGVVGMATLDPMAGIALWREQRAAARERRRAARELYGRRTVDRSGVRVDLEDLKMLRTSVRYAIGAYGTGSSLLSDASLRDKLKSLELRAGDRDRDLAHAQATEACARACGIPRDDVVKAEWSGTAFSPSSFVAVDREEARVVLSVRGTWEFHDALTDVSSESAPFLHGWAHSGMVVSAWQIVKRMLPAVAESMAKYPTFDFLITGHSMGGGVAACVAMLMHSRDGDIEAIATHAMGDVSDDVKREVLQRLASCQCVCIAAPSVSSMDLSESASEYITCVVAGADVIPRLCHSSVRRLLRRLNRAAPSHAMLRAVSSALGGRDRPTAEQTQTSDDEDESERADAGVAGASDGGTSQQVSAPSPARQREKNRRSCQGDWVEVEDVVGLELRDHAASDFMVQPGRVIHLDHVRSDMPTAEYKHPTAFTDVVLDPYMMLDHIPGVYQAAVKAIHDRVLAGGSSWVDHDEDSDEDSEEGDEEDPLGVLLKAETVRARARQGWRSVRNFFGVDVAEASQERSVGEDAEAEYPVIPRDVTPPHRSFPSVDTSDEDIPDYFGEDARARALHRRRPPRQRPAEEPSDTTHDANPLAHAWDWIANT